MAFSFSFFAETLYTHSLCIYRTAASDLTLKARVFSGGDKRCITVDTYRPIHWRHFRKWGISPSQVYGGKYANPGINTLTRFRMWNEPILYMHRGPKLNIYRSERAVIILRLSGPCRRLALLEIGQWIAHASVALTGVWHIELFRIRGIWVLLIESNNNPKRNSPQELFLLHGTTLQIHGAEHESLTCSLKFSEHREENKERKCESVAFFIEDGSVRDEWGIVGQNKRASGVILSRRSASFFVLVWCNLRWSIPAEHSIVESHAPIPPSPSTRIDNPMQHNYSLCI